MGSVHEVHDKELDRAAALKLLKIDSRTKASSHERFLREARTLASLKHPHLLEVFEFGAAGDDVFLVTELVKGTSFEDLAPDQDPRAGWMQIGDALAAVHAAGMLHRDIKPENALLSPDRGAVLIDFGLALVKGLDRITVTGKLLGPIRYLAPEVLGRGVYSAESDWYAWGFSLYWLLEGEIPFDLGELQEAARTQELPPPGFERVTDKGERAALRELLQGRPEDRPSTWEEIQSLLAGTSKGATKRVPRPRKLAATTTSIEKNSPEPPPLRRGRFASGFLALFLAVAIGATLSAFLHPSPAPDPTPARSLDPEDPWRSFLEGDEVLAFEKASRHFDTTGMEFETPLERDRYVLATYVDPRTPVRAVRLYRLARDLGRRIVELARETQVEAPPRGVFDLLDAVVFPALGELHALGLRSAFLLNDEGRLDAGLGLEERRELREQILTLATRRTEIKELKRSLPPWPSSQSEPIAEILLLLEVLSDQNDKGTRNDEYLDEVLEMLRRPRSEVHPGWRAAAGIEITFRQLLMAQEDCAAANDLYAALRQSGYDAFRDRPVLDARLDLSLLWPHAALVSTCRGSATETVEADIEALSERVLARGRSSPFHVLLAADTIVEYQMVTLLSAPAGSESPPGFKRILKEATAIRRRRRSRN
jgi:serine/threonine protein kinase